MQGTYMYMEHIINMEDVEGITATILKSSFTETKLSQPFSI